MMGSLQSSIHTNHQHSINSCQNPKQHNNRQGSATSSIHSSISAQFSLSNNNICRNSHTSVLDHSCNLVPEQIDELHAGEANVHQSMRPYNAPVVSKYRLIEDLLPPNIRMLKQYNRSKQLHQRKHLKIIQKKESLMKNQPWLVQDATKLAKNKGISSQQMEGNNDIKKFPNESKSENANHCQQAKRYGVAVQTVCNNDHYFKNMHQEVVNRLLDIIKDNCNSMKSHPQDPTGRKSMAAQQQGLAMSKPGESLQPIIINNMVPPDKDSGCKPSKASEGLEAKQKRIQMLQNQRESIQIQQHLAYSTPKYLKSSVNRRVSAGRSSKETKNVDVQSLQSLELQAKTPSIDKAEEGISHHIQSKHINSPVSECLDGVQGVKQIPSSESPDSGPNGQSKGSQIDAVHAQGVQFIESSRQHTPPLKDAKNTAKPEGLPLKQHQAPVLIQIPIDSSTPFAGMSLAEAFKKKLGQLPSERTQSALCGLESEHSGAPQSFQSTAQFSAGVSKIRHNYSSVPLSASQVTRKPLRRSKPKPKLANKQNRVHQSYPGLQQVATPKPRNEPSEQLINRLIYGGKAKVTKKQMYALTKKNYQNLPEVQARKKVEQKKELERLRISKIKEYQKSIRSSKKSIVCSLDERR